MNYYIYDTNESKRINKVYDTALEAFEAIIKLINQEEIDELNGKTEKDEEESSSPSYSEGNQSFDWTLTGNPNGIYIPTYKIIPTRDSSLPGNAPFVVNENSEEEVSKIPEPVVDSSEDSSGSTSNNNSSNNSNDDSNNSNNNSSDTEDEYTLDDATYAKFKIMDSKSYIDEEVEASELVEMMRQITSLTTSLLANLSSNLKIDDIKIISPTGNIGDMFAVNQNDCLEDLNNWLMERNFHYQIIVDDESIKNDIEHYYKENPYEIINLVNILNQKDLYVAWQDAKKISYNDETILDGNFNEADNYRKIIDDVLYSATKYDVLVEYFNDINTILNLLKDNDVSVNITVKKLLDKWKESSSEFIKNDSSNDSSNNLSNNSSNNSSEENILHTVNQAIKSITNVSGKKVIKLNNKVIRN